MIEKDELIAKYWAIIAAMIQDSGNRKVHISGHALRKARATVTQLDILPDMLQEDGIVVHAYTYGPAIERFEREGE